MKKTLLLPALFSTLLCTAQFQFPELQYHPVANGSFGARFGYPTSPNFTFVNTACSASPNCLEYEDRTTLLCTWMVDSLTRIDFHFTAGSSDDPAFLAVHEGKIIFEASGTSLHIKGNTLYVEGIANAYFDKKRKFKLSNGLFTEVKQPYYAIGVKGTLNFPIEIFQSEDFHTPVAVLPKGYQVEIVMGKTGGAYDDLQAVLIKSEFGLLGWYNFAELGFAEYLIDGFYFHGD